MKSREYIPKGEEWAFRVSMTRRRLAKMRIQPQGNTKQTALALRRVFPELGTIPVSEFLERLRVPELELGPYSEQKAIRFESDCREAGISVSTSYYIEESGLLIDTRGPAAWLIEDDEENRDVIRDAIARGVKIDENENGA